MEAKRTFDGIYQRLSKMIIAYIYKRLGNVHDTEDVHAEVFVAVWKMIDNLPVDETEQRRYVYAIAKNKIADFLRKKYIAASYTSAAEIEELPEVVIERNPSTNIAIRESLAQLVSELNEKEKQFYQLRFARNYTLSAVAREMGIELNNVKVMQNRLIKKLKRLWEMQMD